MEQRPLRLGDIVDDYCPRERRITNHAIVAIVGDTVRQTRCTTCEAEHVYKEGRVPRRLGKKKDAEVAPGQLVQPRAETVEDSPPPVVAEALAEPAEPLAVNGSPGSFDVTSSEEPQAEGADDRGAEGWLANRPLIRATLPRTEGEPPIPRPIPEFTMHQRPMRSARHGHGWQGGNGHPPPNGFREGRSGNERHGQGRPGQGGGKPGRHRGGRHKRSR